MSTTQKKIIHLTRRVLLLITLIIIVAFPCFSQSQTKDDKYWALSKEYCNARFGFCVYYPASLIKAAEPENNDGCKFDNGNGLEMTVSGINNVSHDTLQSEMSAAEKRFDKITYRAKRKNSFIMKGQKGDTIIFLRTYIGRGSVNHLEIQVPVPLQENYSQIVSDIAGSFSPGKVGVSH